MHRFKSSDVSASGGNKKQALARVLLPLRFDFYPVAYDLMYPRKLADLQRQQLPGADVVPYTIGLKDKQIFVEQEDTRYLVFGFCSFVSRSAWPEEYHWHVGIREGSDSLKPERQALWYEYEQGYPEIKARAEQLLDVYGKECMSWPEKALCLKAQNLKI